MLTCKKDEEVSKIGFKAIESSQMSNENYVTWYAYLVGEIVSRVSYQFEESESHSVVHHVGKHESL